MENLVLTKAQARRFLLAHQGLWPPYVARGKEGVLEYIRRVGCIQFDPLNVVGLNPELVLQSRVTDFRPEMLRELLYHDRKLLDGWDKNMSIYTVEDWPCFKRIRDRAWRHVEKDVLDALPRVREAVRERGPLSSIDLESETKIRWPWGSAPIVRAVLESMYNWGELVIHHRVHVRKVYDFAANHLAEELLMAPEPNVSEEEHRDWRLWRRIGGIGLVWNRPGDAWLALPGNKVEERTAALERLLAREKITEVAVEGVKFPFYLRSDDRRDLERVLTEKEPAAHAAFLAPLDNLLWDRKLIKELFGFEYKWEVYTPEKDRRFGYYVLPVLYGDRFVARFEPEREKKSGGLVVKNWWWEPGVKPTKKMREAINSCFKRFLGFLGTEGLDTGPFGD